MVSVFYLRMCVFFPSTTKKSVRHYQRQWRYRGLCCQKMNKLLKVTVLNRIISVCLISNVCSLVIFILHEVLAYFLLSKIGFFRIYIFSFYRRSSQKSIRTKINNDSRWNTCTIAHKHKHSIFRSKATGASWALEQLGKKPSNTDNVLHVCIWVHDNIQTGRARLGWPSPVPQCVRTVPWCSSLSWPLSLSAVSVLSVQWESCCGRPLCC